MVCNTFPNRKIAHGKWTLHTMCGAIWASSRAVLNLISSKFAFLSVYMFRIYHDVGGSTEAKEF